MPNNKTTFLRGYKYTGRLGHVRLNFLYRINNISLSNNAMFDRCSGCSASQIQQQLFLYNCN